MCSFTGLTKDEVEEAIRLSGTAADEVMIIKKYNFKWWISPVLNMFFFTVCSLLILDIQGYKKKIFYIYRLNIVVFLDFSTYQSSSSPSERSKGSNLKVSRQKNVILHINCIFKQNRKNCLYGDIVLHLGCSIEPFDKNHLSARR